MTIDGNTMIGGWACIRLNGTSVAAQASGNRITNNIFKDYYNYGSYNYYSTDLIIHNNDYSRPTRTSLSTFYGPYVGYNSKTTISNNKIHDGGAGTYTNYAIYVINSVNTAVGRTYIANNAVYNNNTTGTQYPIYLTSTCSYNTIVNNTIQITSGGTATIRGIYVSSTPNNLDVTNNLISVIGSGTGTKVCYYSSSSSTFSGSNNLFYMGASAGTNNNTAYYSGNKSTISDWTTATTTTGKLWSKSFYYIWFIYSTFW